MDTIKSKIENQQSKIILLIVCLWTAAVVGAARAEVSDEIENQKSKIKQAIETGILTPYDIPFTTFVALEMWDEIEGILRANHRNITVRPLPGLYYSRPLVIGDRIWLFENPTVSAGTIYVIHPETLAVEQSFRNEAFTRFDGGIRTVAGQRILAGGGNADVDAVVLWDTAGTSMETLQLRDGHYVGSIAVGAGRIFVGACGGVVEAWKGDGALTYVGAYRSSEGENVSWQVFNQKACITALTTVGNRLVGAGEREIFVWDIESRELEDRLPKQLPNGIAGFSGETVVEHRHGSVAVWPLNDPDAVRTIQTRRSVEDVLVTEEKLLADFDGRLLVLAMRHNKGFRFHDFETLKLIRRSPLPGEALGAYNGSLYATDDRHLYRYHIANRDPEAYEAFVSAIQPGEIPVDDATYDRLVDLLADYPRVMAATGMVPAQLDRKGIDLSHKLKYGRIGQRFVPWGEPADSVDTALNGGDPSAVYGYKAIYTAGNRSDQYYLVTLDAAWSGEYGKSAAYAEAARHPSTAQSFFLPPGATFQNQIEVGPREPVHLAIYPRRIEPVTAEFHEGLRRALSPENTDVDQIDRYLDDDRVAQWHPRLTARREALTAGGDGFWLFRLLRRWF